MVGVVSMVGMVCIVGMVGMVSMVCVCPPIVVGVKEGGKGSSCAGYRNRHVAVLCVDLLRKRASLANACSDNFHKRRE